MGSRILPCGDASQPARLDFMLENLTPHEIAGGSRESLVIVYKEISSCHTFKALETRTGTLAFIFIKEPGIRFSNWM